MLLQYYCAISGAIVCPIRRWNSAFAPEIDVMGANLANRPGRRWTQVWCRSFPVAPESLIFHDFSFPGLACAPLGSELETFNQPPRISLRISLRSSSTPLASSYGSNMEFWMRVKRLSDDQMGFGWTSKTCTDCRCFLLVPNPTR